MSEKLPSGDRPPVRMVGPAPEEVKKYFTEVVRGKFAEDQFGQLSEEELVDLAESQRPKETYELKFIEKANEITNNLLRDFGLPEFNVPERNIQIIKDEFYRKIHPIPGATAFFWHPASAHNNF